MQNQKIQTYEEFWPFYLSQHSLRATKFWHTWGLVVAWLVGLTGLFFNGPIFILVGLVLGYAAAWYSHFFIEKNRPATFQYPVWSFISDFRMAYLVLTRKLK